jgi:hypothetical protein
VLLTSALCGCMKSVRKERCLDARECEARLADVAIPIEHVPVENFLSDQSYGYISSAQREWLMTFYENEMERLGWKNNGVVASGEITLMFEKPHAYAVVSMRPERKKWRVHITKIQR